MDAHSVIEDWETVPFEGGVDGLAELVAHGFDGAVEAAGTWLFFRDGEPIAAVSDLESDPRPAGIDAFEGAAGERHEAPSSGDAALAAMLVLDGDVRGRYFSDDTPLSAVHDTLSGGGFTGYVELSENVLSGDYYYVYVDGDVEHVGFIGSNRRIAGEEAKTKAENEIGIYAVVAVSFPDLEIPDGSDDSTAVVGAGSSETTDAETDVGADTDAEPDTETHTEADVGEDPKASGAASDAHAETEVETEPEDAPSATEEPSKEDPDSVSGTAVAAEPEKESGDDSAPTAGSKPDDESRDTDRGTDRGEVPERSEAPATPDDESVGAEERPSSPAATETEESTADTHTSRPETAPDEAATGGAGRQQRRAPSDDTTASRGGIDGLVTRQVPSLDPEQSTPREPESTHSESRGARPDRQTSAGNRDAGTTQSRAGAAPNGQAGERGGATDADIEEYESRIEEYESEITDLETELSERDTRIEELESELESLRDERDELRTRLDQLESEGSMGIATNTMSAAEAFRKTSLFVRETTRGEGTLEAGHDGTADKDAVTENIRIEYHTTFDAEQTAVEGEPFEAWLRSSSRYAFAEWLILDLLFEIRSTDTQDGLRPLYDALPAIDRIGFNQTITVGSGTEGREIPFDFVARNKKGNPLMVAAFDQSRDPTYAETVTPFVTDTSDVCEDHDTLTAGFVVTASYFEADAMEATEEATSTSLLSRSKHRSYVKLTRSDGFHLCLVEARDDSFNMTVPEL